MKIVFVFTGKTFKGPILDIVSDYKKRISRYLPVEIIEAKRSLKFQARPGFHIVLTPMGKSLGSRELADLIERHASGGTKNMFFYVGGPDGFDSTFKEDEADMKISLSAMTFNHQVVRIMLMEQVYRALTIINSMPYHR